MSNIVKVDNSNFDIEVINSELPVLVDFSAIWCGPCQRQLPVLEKFATDHGHRVKIVKIDIDDSPELSAKFSVRSVPTLILFDKGTKVDFKSGLQSAVAIDNWLLEKLSI